MRVREFAKTVDHTLLKPDATEEEVRRVCREAAHYHFAAVCVLPCHVRLAARELRGTDVKVATVVSFPLRGRHDDRSRRRRSAMPYRAALRRSTW
jgi:deoxyribose-phosphate aldolase